MKILYRSVFGPKFRSPFLGPIFDFGGFFKDQILTLNFLLLKRHSLAWSRVVWAIARKIYRLIWTVARSLKRYMHIKIPVIFPPFCRKAPSKWICTKFCTGGRFTDVITFFKFCVDRLRGFGSARGRILPFSIDTGLPYRAPVIKQNTILWSNMYFAKIINQHYHKSTNVGELTSVTKDY